VSGLGSFRIHLATSEEQHQARDIRLAARNMQTARRICRSMIMSSLCTVHASSRLHCHERRVSSTHELLHAATRSESSNQRRGEATESLHVPLSEIEMYNMARYESPMGTHGTGIEAMLWNFAGFGSGCP